MSGRPHPHASPLEGWIDLTLCTAKSYGDGTPRGVGPNADLVRYVLARPVVLAP